MADARLTPTAQPSGATACLVFGDGRVAWGMGFGAEGSAVGELCFHTAMTGYQEVMTDPSFARQVIAFTFPHIGNVGANDEDFEADDPHALGCIVREAVTGASNFRSTVGFAEWMAAHKRIGISGLDTRALTRLVRREGPPNVVIAHSASGEFDVAALQRQAAEWPGLEGMDLAKEVSRAQLENWSGGKWSLTPPAGAGGEEPRSGEGEGLSPSAETGPPPLAFGESTPPAPAGGAGAPHVVAIDYGSKRNIFRNLVEAGAKVTIVPASASFDEIMALKPSGIFLSNGPGDPAATGEYAVPVIRQLLETKLPLFGICLGHQLLALAVGGRTSKMFQGHRGANHPVKRLADGAVEITSMNHGFAVEREGMPANVRETHVSLFDDSNCGLELTDRPAFSVQYHPEASPGPQDSFYLFEKFVGMMRNFRPDTVVNLSERRSAIKKVARQKLLDETIELAESHKVQRALKVRQTIKWLEPNAPVPKQLAVGLVRHSAWWHTHSSGSPVRAPNHSNRIRGNESTWTVDFGANSFLIARAIRFATTSLNLAYDAIINGNALDLRRLRLGIRGSLQRSVSNVNNDIYDLYPVAGQDMMFGAQSIDLEDATKYLITQAGLDPFIGKI